MAAWCRSQGALDLLSIDAADVARYRTACEVAGASTATIARRLSAIASFGTFAAANGAEPALATSTDFARPAMHGESTTQLLSDDEAAALLTAADAIGARSALLVRLLMLDGLKAGEILLADASDLSTRPPPMTLALRSRAEPPRPLHLETAAVARRYLGRRREGPLLLSERRGRPRERLTRFGLVYLIKQTARVAGLDGAVSGNTLRRRYVIAAHEDGAALDTIRHNAGHANQRTTRRYLRATTSPAPTASTDDSAVGR